MWSNLVKFRHFGKNLEIFGNIFKNYFLFGSVELTLSQLFIIVNGQILKNNFTIWTHCHIRIYSHCSFQCSIPFHCDGQIGVLRADRILRKHLRKLNRLRHIQFLEIRNLCQSKTTIRCIIWISNLTKCRGKQVTYVHDQLSFKYCAQFVRCLRNVLTDLCHEVNKLTREIWRHTFICNAGTFERR